MGYSFNPLNFNTAMKNRFKGKVYRLALSSGASCPNRDGKVGYGGCIFCSEGGSGEFAVENDGMDVSRQIECAKSKVENKVRAAKARDEFAGYVAYYQSFTNTYYRNEEELERFRKLYTEAIESPEVVALSIGTRPDCIDDKILSMLKDLKSVKPVWVELGLQSSNDETGKFINRGYDTSVYDEAVKKLHGIGVEVITHVIVGLPNEDDDDVIETVRHVVKVSKETRPSGWVNESDGIKISLLYVLENTLLAGMISSGKCSMNEYTLEGYGCILQKLLELIPDDMVVHRITGDPPKKLLISPKWTADKKRVLNYLNSLDVFF